MRWQDRASRWLWVGTLAACHSGGDAAPDGNTPAAPPAETAAETSAEGTPAQAPAGETPAASSGSSEPATPGADGAEPPATADAACDSRRAGIEAALGEAGRCASDSDCTLMYPDCPFGCARPIATSADQAKLRASIDSYKAACNSCVYRCMPPSGAPTCNAGRCTFGGG